MRANIFDCVGAAVLLACLATLDVFPRLADGQTSPSQISSNAPYVIFVRSRDVPYVHDAACYVQVGDEIWVDVQNLSNFCAAIDVRKLVLFFDDVPLPGIHPDEASQNRTEMMNDNGQQTAVTHLRFVLVRQVGGIDNDDLNRAWLRLLEHPHGMNHSLKVSVGFPNGVAMMTNVDPVGNKDVPANQLNLVLMPMLGSTICLILVGALLALFCFLAYRTDVLRDNLAPTRADGKRIVSLARSQMAFWTFLIVGAYLFLLLVTREPFSFNSSVLALLGISAGTAIGSAFIDTGKAVTVTGRGRLAQWDFSANATGIQEQLNAKIQPLRDRVSGLEATRSTIDLLNVGALQANDEARLRLLSGKRFLWTFSGTMDRLAFIDFK
jgi:hypothetical protein